MRLCPAIALALLAAAPAAASQTEWQEVAPGVRLRLIADDVRRPDGTTMVGLEIDMPENTKTYWRVPGETGIATELDIAGSTGIAGFTMLWPYPLVDQSAGYLDYVYYGPTVLPIALDLTGESAVLQASVTLGVCSDVCVPAMAEFSLPLSFGTPDAGQQIRLSQAVALTPLPWTGSSPPVGAVSLDAAADALAVVLADPEVDPHSLIADMGPGGTLFGAPQKSPDGKVVFLPLLGGSDPEGLMGQPVQFTFMTPMGAFEISRVIDSATAALAMAR